MNKPRPNVLRLISHMLAAVFNSRSAFQREWQRYEGLPANGTIEGRWGGEWVSSQSGHRGDLKCVLTPSSPDVYHAFFYATFSRFFRVGYATDLKAQQASDRVYLKGEEDLGKLAGGVYRCEGEIIGADFNCHYSCKYDQGVFRLKRLAISSQK
jgi:hypothetical protein